MEIIDFINIICPEHDRTSCSDEDLNNGFFIDDFGTVDLKYRVRCKRCAYLQVARGEVGKEKFEMKWI